MRYPSWDAINYNMEPTLSPPKIIEITNKKNHVTYLYEDRHYWDPQKKQTRHKRRCVGKLDAVTGQRIYNSAYREAMSQQAAADSQVIPAFSSPGLARLQLYVQQHCRSLGRLRDLLGHEATEHLLYLAWYLLCNRRPLSYALYWEQGHSGLHQCPADQDAVRKLLCSLDVELLRMWQLQQAQPNRTYAVFDLCSTASYENHNPYLQYGYNRDSEALEQNTIVLLTGYDRFEPLSFRLLPGTMLNTQTIGETLSYLNVESPSILMLNRRFFSLQRIEQLVGQDRSFLFRVPTRQQWLDELIAANRRAVEEGTILLDMQQRPIRGVRLIAPFLAEKPLYVHLFYDEQWRNSQKENLFALLGQCKRELETEQRVDEHARLYETYFKVRRRSGCLHQVQLSSDPLLRFEASPAGFWALVTNTELSSQQALTMYEKRNAFERRFDNLLNYDDCRYLQVHNPNQYTGRVFLQLVSETIRAVLSDALRQCDITVEQMLFSMTDLQQVSFSAHGTQYRSRMTALQKRVDELLHLGLEM